MKKDTRSLKQSGVLIFVLLLIAFLLYAGGFIYRTSVVVDGAAPPLTETVISPLT